MPFRDQIVFDPKLGKVRPPIIIRKVCVHNAADIEPRFRGDMALDMETYGGIRQLQYVCLQCGKTKSADTLMDLMQAYALLGIEVKV